MHVARAVAAALVLVAALPAGAATEQERLEQHFATVLGELRAADVTRLDRQQRAAREAVIAELERYAARGVFPRNEGFPSSPLPAFIDGHDTRCAMAHLIESTGGGAFVAEVARERNHAYIAELADDPRLHAWLDEHGISLEEAARIQPAYGAEKVTLASLFCGPFWHVDSGGYLIVARVTVAAVRGPEHDWELDLRVDRVLGGTNPTCGELGQLKELERETLTLQYGGDELAAGSQHTVLLSRGELERACWLRLLGVFPPDGVWSSKSGGQGWVIPVDEPFYVPNDVLIDALSVADGVACMEALAAYDPALMCEEHEVSVGGFGAPIPYRADGYLCGAPYFGPRGGGSDHDGGLPLATGMGCQSTDGGIGLAWIALLALWGGRRARAARRSLNPRCR